MHFNSAKYYLFLFFLFALLGCSEKKEKNVNSSRDSTKTEDEFSQQGKQKQIIVYGSMDCDHCLTFIRKLDSRGIEYEFRDVDESDTYFLELRQKIASINYTGYVQFPVLDIEGSILVNPDFKEALDRVYSK